MICAATVQTARSGYNHKFVCRQCSEIVFVFGQTRNPSPFCYGICLAVMGWQTILPKRTVGEGPPDGLIFHEGLQALMAVGSLHRGAMTSVHCIYLDDWGRSMREP